MLLQFPTMVEHMLRVEFRFSSSELQRRNGKKTQLQHRTLCFWKLLSRYWRWDVDVCIYIFLPETSQLNMAEFQFCSICQSVSVSMSIRDSEISEFGNSSFSILDNLNRSWNDSQKTEFVYEISRCLRWFWAGTESYSETTESRQRLFNKDLTRKWRQQSYPRKTPEKMFSSAKCPLVVLLHMSQRQTRSDITEQGHWSLLNTWSSSHRSIRLHHLNRPTDKSAHIKQ